MDYTKYLVLKISNAKLFRQNKVGENIKDVVIENGKFSTRTKIIRGNKAKKIPSIYNTKYFVEPITEYQINNMLQVLIGDRPIPTFRNVIYTNNQGLKKISQNSYLKLDEDNVYYTKKGERRIRKEIISTQKAHWNSTSAESNVNYNSLFNYLEQEDYNTFMDFCLKILELSSIDEMKNRYTLLNLIKEIRKIYFSKSTPARRNELENIKYAREIPNKNGEFEIMFDNFLKMNRKQLFNILNNNDFDKNFKSLISGINTSKNRMNTPRGIGMTEVYNGTILVPITDTYLEMIRNGTGHSTILDGGRVEIINILNKKDINFNGFVKVGDIDNKIMTEL